LNSEVPGRLWANLIRWLYHCMAPQKGDSRKAVEHDSPKTQIHTSATETVLEGYSIESCSSGFSSIWELNRTRFFKNLGDLVRIICCWNSYFVRVLQNRDQDVHNFVFYWFNFGRAETDSLRLRMSVNNGSFTVSQILPTTSISRNQQIYF